MGYTPIDFCNRMGYIISIVNSKRFQMDKFFRVLRWVMLPLCLLLAAAFALTGQWGWVVANLIFFAMWLQPIPD